MTRILLSLGAALAVASYAVPADACGNKAKKKMTTASAEKQGCGGDVMKAEGCGGGCGQAKEGGGCGAMAKADGSCGCPAAVTADLGPPLDPNKKVAAGQSYVSIKIDGMRCGMCVAHIEESLAALKGVIEAEVVYGYGARVVFDTKQVKLEDLKKAIEQAGYKPTLPQT
jgi:copper chaperone CopZ